MIRVLHLFSRETTFQTEHGISLLTDPTRSTFQSVTLTIGRGCNFRSALGAAATLRFSHSGFNLIHAWDPSAFIAAVASGLPVIFSPSEPVKRGSWSWLATAAYGDVHVVSATRWACKRQIQAGLHADRCHVIVPGLESFAISPQAAADLRSRLGISPAEFVILAPGESARAVRHRVAWHAASILRVLDQRYRLLIWGRGPEVRAVREVSIRLKQPDLVIDAERRLGREIGFEELIQAADAALVTAESDASVLPIAACAAAGLPIVALDSALMREVFCRNDAAIVPRKDVRTLAQRLLELTENAGEREALGGAAKLRAAKLFDPARFLREYSELYERVANRHRPGEGAMNVAFGGVSRATASESLQI